MDARRAEPSSLTPSLKIPQGRVEIDTEGDRGLLDDEETKTTKEIMKEVMDEMFEVSSDISREHIHEHRQQDETGL